MTRIAIFADIHANMPALRAVIEDIRTQDVDEVLVGGDLVGRGPQGSAVVTEITSQGWPCIRGNHEDYLLNFINRNVPDEWLHTPEWSAARWMANELDAHSTQFIDSLVMTMHSPSAPDLRLVHGSPKAYNDGIGTWTHEEKLNEHINAIDESLLVCAHTHRPFDVQLPQGRIVNVGSVGMPFNGDHRAQYAIFEWTDYKQWQVTFRQVPYDRQEILDHYHASGFYAEGGITAQLLYIELQRARPYLVPFLKWAEVTSHTPSPVHLDEFLDLYDDSKPMSELIALLQQQTDSD